MLTSKIALIGALAISAYASESWADDDQRCTQSHSAAAIDLLRDKVRSEKLYTWTTEQCLWFEPEHCDVKFVDIAIRELHSAACGGDPNTAPVVDRFRVHRRTNDIEWYNAADDLYLEFSNVHSSER